MHRYRTSKSGFTLVEILIVVIILGILAAIVIPQFSNASTDARESSARSLNQTVRSAIELYKLEHGDQYPTDDGLKDGDFDLTLLTTVTTYNSKSYGPYLQQTPVNPLNGLSTVATGTDYDAGWHWDSTLGKITATNGAKDGLFE